MQENNWLDSKFFEKMKWLRFVSTIWLFSGTGDSLVNPHFPEIARTVRHIAPHSRIGIFTNGLGLDGDNLEAILETHDILHVSLNAIKRETYDSIIKGGYDRVMRNLEELGRRKPKSLYVEVSLILMKKTLGDVEPMIDLASKLGFEKVITCLFILVDTTSSKRFGKQEVLTTNKELEQRMTQLKNYAQKREVAFTYSGFNHPPKLCYEPWRVAYLTNTWIGERQFLLCCGGVINIHVEPSVYVDFKKAWNSKRVQHVRKTVNLPLEQQNTMCYLCRTLDKSEKNWKEKAHKIAPTLKEVTFHPFDVPIPFNRKYIK